MPSDYLTLGPTPAEESCTQVGDDNYHEKAKKECRAYMNQLVRLFGKPPDGARFTVKSFAHDFGSCKEVCVYYDNKESREFAFKVESDLPGEWDAEARKELGI